MNDTTLPSAVASQKQRSWLLVYFYYSMFIAVFFVGLTIMGVYLEHVGLGMFIRHSLEFGLQMFLCITGIMWAPVLMFLGVRRLYHHVRSTSQSHSDS